MLSPDDLEIVKRDSDVPGLATVLDAGALTLALRNHLPDAAIEAVEPIYVHYKPQTNCLVAFRVRTTEGEALAYAKAYGADAGVKLEKTRELLNVPSPVGPGTLILESTNIGVYFFPIDHRLKSLRRLARPDTQRSLIRELFGDFPEYSTATLRHLRYKPERRYVAYLETPSRPRFLVKFFTPAGYRAAKAAAQAFCFLGQTGKERRTYFLDRHNVMGLEWLPGRLLSDTILAEDEHEGDSARAIESAGSALAEMHSAAPAKLRKISRADEIRRLEAQATTIWHLCPALGARAEGLVGKIIPALEKLSKEKTALHGDFYDKQVLLSDGIPVILDLDEARLGHPGIDLGLFIAHLERHQLYDRVSEVELDNYADALVRGYQRARRAPSAAAIHLYTAIGLLHLAAEPFRYRDQHWRDQAEKILARVDALLNRHFSAIPLSHARS